jgi:hypothetical protein
VCDCCAEHYFSQPNYLKLDESHVFGIFDANKLMQEVGDKDGLKRALDAMCTCARRSTAFAFLMEWVLAWCQIMPIALICRL